MVLKKATQIMGCGIHATDGDIGTVSTVFFDDEHWTVRYFVVDTGKWLPGRKVLISPTAIGQFNWDVGSLDVSLTREQVKNSPDIDTDRPVSRQHEMQYYRYYGYPTYWGGAGLAPGAYSGVLARGDEAFAMAELRAMDDADESSADSHLRDAKVVKGYHIRAADGDIGHVEDFLIDDQGWAIRYMLVDTSNWLGGRHVLIAPSWVSAVSWGESKVDLAMNRQAVEDSPEYNPANEVNRDYEGRLYAYYGHTGYWIGAAADSETRADSSAVGDQGLARLDDLGDVEVADGEPDVKDWNVFASDGIVVGTVEHLIVERGAMKVRYLEVGLEGGLSGQRNAEDVLIPIEQVDLDEPNEAVRLRGMPSSRVSRLPAFGGLPIELADEQRLRTPFTDQAGGSVAARDLRVGRREQVVNRESEGRHDADRENTRPRDPRLDEEDPSRNR